MPLLTPAPASLNIPLLEPPAQRTATMYRSDELDSDLERLQYDLDALARFGFGIEQHPYRGVAYRGPADGSVPTRSSTGWPPANRLPDRGLEPGHEHQ